MSSLSSRDWAALPRDILVDVFVQLGPLEVMASADIACAAWRRAALEEPSLWRRVGMDGELHLWQRWVRDPEDRCWRRFGIRYETAKRLAAVDRAAGQCEAFRGPCRDKDMLPLVTRAPSLRSLSIGHHSKRRSGKYLVEALQKLTLLEDLEINFKYIIHPDENMLQSICKACPGLKKLVVKYVSFYDLECNEDQLDKEPIDGAIPVMGKLHTLKLCQCDLSEKGLNAILDSCPLLENLYIDGYFDKRRMDKELRIKCSRVKSLNLNTHKKPDNNSYLGDYLLSDEEEL